MNTELEQDAILNKRASIAKRHRDCLTRKDYCLIDIEVAKLEGDPEKLRSSMCELLKLETSIQECEREGMRVVGELQYELAMRRITEREREREEKRNGSLWGRFLLFLGWK